MKNNNPKQLEPRLEALLIESDFANLDPTDQAYAMEWLDEKTFQEMRHVLLASREVLAKAPSPPAPALRNQLMQQFREQHRTPNPLLSIATRRVPLWQAVSGIAAAVLFLLMVQQPKEILVQAPPQIVYEYKTDTVFKEVPAQLASAPNSTSPQLARRIPTTRPDTPVVVNQNPRKVPRQMEAIANRRPGQGSEKTDRLLLASNDSADFQQVIRQYRTKPTNGRSISVDKELMDFITEVY